MTTATAAGRRGKFPHYRAKDHQFTIMQYVVTDVDLAGCSSGIKNNIYQIINYHKKPLEFLCKSDFLFSISISMYVLVEREIDILYLMEQFDRMEVSVQLRIIPVEHYV